MSMSSCLEVRGRWDSHILLQKAPEVALGFVRSGPSSGATRGLARRRGVLFFIEGTRQNLVSSLTPRTFANSACWDVGPPHLVHVELQPHAVMH